MMHDTINRFGNDLVPHCENCGACWRAVGTRFAQEVTDRLRADDLAPNSPASGSKQ
jgi:hypothetical protein